MRKTLILGILLSLSLLGCSTQDIQRAQTDLNVAKTQFNATTQATSDAQTALDAIKKVAATQPSDPKFQAAIQQAQKIVDAAVATQVKADAALQLAQSVLDAAKNGTPPDTTPLHVFGPYGDIAAILVTAGFAVYKHVQASQASAKVEQQSQTIAAQTPLLDHAQDVTGADSHVAAMTILTAPLTPAPNGLVPAAPKTA